MLLSLLSEHVKDERMGIPRRLPGSCPSVGLEFMLDARINGPEFRRVTVRFSAG